MISRWEMKEKPIKRVFAQYAVGEGVSSCFLICEVPKIIAKLYRYNLIINNITADSASENRSAFNRIAKNSMEEITTKCNYHLTANQHKLFPLEKKIAFRHPVRKHIIVFIGGEMPHLVKKMPIHLRGVVQISTGQIFGFVVKQCLCIC